MEENRLTTVIVTHSMSQALDLSNRTIVMQKAKIIKDLSGEKKECTKIENLLNKFSELRKKELLDDELISIYQYAA